MGRKPKEGAVDFYQLLGLYNSDRVKAGQQIYFIGTSSTFRETNANKATAYRGTLVSVVEDTSRNPALGHNPVKLQNVSGLILGTDEQQISGEVTLYHYKQERGSFYLNPAGLACNLEKGNWEKATIDDVLGFLVANDNKGCKVKQNVR